MMALNMGTSSSSHLLANPVYNSISNSPSPSLEPHSPNLIASDAQNGEPEDTSSLLNDVDPQILEALKSKDRLYVLKLGELMEGLINEQRCADCAFEVLLSHELSMGRLPFNRSSRIWLSFPRK
jgi:hypothetical protein